MSSSFYAFSTVLTVYMLPQAVTFTSANFPYHKTRPSDSFTQRTILAENTMASSLRVMLNRIKTLVHKPCAAGLKGYIAIIKDTASHNETMMKN